MTPRILKQYKDSLLAQARDYDYSRVVKTMAALKWTWWDKPSGPTADDMKQSILHNIDVLFEIPRQAGDYHYCSSGGFKVWYDTRLKRCGIIFMAAESDKSVKE